MMVAAHAHKPITTLAALLALATLGGCMMPGSRGLSAWIVPADELLGTDTPRSGENSVYSESRGEIELLAGLNETVAFQIALRAAEPPAGPFDIRISDLAGPTATLPAASAVSIFRAHYTRIEKFRSWYPAAAGRPAVPTVFPDILVPWDAPRGGGPLVLSESRNEIAWVDIHVPITLTPGEYRGRLEIRRPLDPEPAFACEIRMRVVSVALPGRRSLPVICRVDPRDLLATHCGWPRTSAEETRLLPDEPRHQSAVRLVRNTMLLLHEHRAAPVLWASFPKFEPRGDRRIDVDWEPYDRLVASWLDGSAFPDRVRLENWPVPVSLEYPDADRNGGLDSPRYARLLATYLEECRRHFAERGWLDRAFLRPCRPAPLLPETVETLRTLAGITRQSETGLPLVAHLPARSLAGFGWQHAPVIDLTDVRIWAPPAMWFEPESMAQTQKLGCGAWLMPDHPPYSGSLAVEALPADARILPWLAFRYHADAIWIENATQADAASLDTPQPWAGPPLVYPGKDFGLSDHPVASIRLKRVRRGQQDYELLRLLEDNGKPLLAESLAGQIVRWAGTDACLDNLLSCKQPGWPADPLILRRARELILNELASTFTPESAPRHAQVAIAARWEQILNQPESIGVTVEGVRLTRSQVGLRAHVRASIVNTSRRTAHGEWKLPGQSTTWRQVRPVISTIPPGTVHLARVDLDLAALAYNTEGVYPFELRFDSPTLGVLPVRARLAVAACRRVENPLQVDGRLDDWPLASDNAAGDFLLCRSAATAGHELAPAPSLGTRAYFCMDRERLYVGVRCSLQHPLPPLWQADNRVPLDGAVPWGQDVVEILVDPRGVVEGTSGDLYSLQIKPSGLLIARRGCRTDPPMGESEPWRCDARVAVSIERDVWIVELAVPLWAFGAEARRNAVWGLNVTRLDARRGEYSSWSGARGYAYSPQSLGNLIMLWP